MLLTQNNSTNLLPKDGEVFLFNNFFDTELSNQFLQKLLQTIQWRQDYIKLFGKTHPVPRLTALYGDDRKTYTYSGILMNPLPWTDELFVIKNSIEKVAKVSFTSVLINLYRNGNDSNGWHSDNEKELGQNPVIGSVSFGSTRIFKIRHLQDKALEKKILLTHGSFLLMQGSTQHFWEHQIPKTAKTFTPRINLTFRIITQ